MTARSVGVCVMMMLMAGSARAGGKPLWSMDGVVVASTESTKWAVRVVPDAAGGFVAAWEENRGRRLCCRDTRDLYAHRLAADGGARWPAQNVQVAADAAGEELLAAAGAPDGGAFLVWRRGGGTLLAQTLNGGGAKQDGIDGRMVFTTPETCEWAPEAGSGVDPDGAGGLVTWGAPALGGTAVIHAMTFARAEGSWTTGSIMDLARGPGLHPAAAVSCGAGRRLVLYWAVAAAGLQFTGQWVDRDGAAAGASFPVGGFQPGARWVHATVAGDGQGGAWVAWAAVNPEQLARTHALHLAWIGPGAKGATMVATGTAGEARTLAMYIPPTMVGTADGPQTAATGELVAWRDTSAIGATGPRAALVARLVGDRLETLAVRREGARLLPGPARPASAKAYTGCAPRLVPAGAGAQVLVWAEEVAAGRWRLLARRLGAVAEEPVTIAGPLAEAPRLYDVATAGDGSLVVAWTAMQPKEFGGVRAQRVAWSGPATK